MLLVVLLQFVLSFDPLLRRVQSFPGVHSLQLHGTGVAALSAYADGLSLLARYGDSTAAFSDFMPLTPPCRVRG